MEDNELLHYGTPRHSGRYPWGSGENPYQHDPAHFASAVKKMKQDGMSEKDIASLMGINTSTLRYRLSVAVNEAKYEQVSRAERLKDKGYRTSTIARMMGVSDSTVRGWLKNGVNLKENAIKSTADMLKDAVKEQKYVDVGKGTEAYIGCSSTTLGYAIKALEDEGYVYHTPRIKQLGTQFETTYKVLCPPGTDFKEMMDVVKSGKISMIGGKTIEDDGKTKYGYKPFTSIDPSKVSIRYGDQGGKDMDGVIQIRPGVEELSLGNKRYAQVRIKVGDNRYLKGMAIYADDLPEGTDIRFNTNKESGTPFEEVLKKLKADSDNPFGARITQKEYIGSDGEKHISAINLVREEGEWDTWSKSLSSQFLAKQPVPLARKQLDLAYDEKKSEYDEIMSLTNPTVKKKLLETYSSDCDSAAVHLQAAGLPRQSWKVILPVPAMPENEIYAPSYQDGENVVLIRYPHAGIFEIPEVRVNNKNPTAKKLLGNSIDAIGIHPKVAEQLSGADFDGDTVLVIPNNDGAIKTSKSLNQLKNFDPNIYFAPDLPKVGKESGFNKGKEMGSVSNLITDMTLKGATMDEIAKAVKHSMVVIDAEKHQLNWRQSYKDNDIAALKEKYQGGADRGASTLVSKASAEERVPQRKQYFISKSTVNEEGEKIYRYTDKTYPNNKPVFDVDPETGQKIPRINPETGRQVYEFTGKVLPYQTKSTKMEEVRDAYELSSGTKIESVYADYANKMKALANQARLSYLDTPRMEKVPGADKTYAEEVASLKAKYNIALKNKPLERQAQQYANVVVAQKKKDNPDMTNEEVRRANAQALDTARIRFGASGKETRVSVTPKEWNAIQAGAITDTLLRNILDVADMDMIKSYAMPKSNPVLSDSALTKAKSMMNSGKYTQAEIASSLGISVSALYNALKQP